MMNGISIVIPNYNGASLLPQILPAAIKALSNTNLLAEIIVADDASTDESINILQDTFANVKIVTSLKNRGFSATANMGIAAAKFNWVLLLNSDVKLESSYFEPLLKYTTQSNVFGVMGRIINWENDEQQDGAKYAKWQGGKIKVANNYIAKNSSLLKSGVASFYLSGANAFINKNIFDKIGGFNQIFSPFYVEDTELGLRAWRYGYACLYEHEAVCRHKTSTTIKKASAKANTNKIYNRNKYFFHYLHLEKSKLPLWYLQTIFEILFQLLLGKAYYLKAFFAFLKSKKQLLIIRNQINNKAALSTASVIEKIQQEMRKHEVTIF
jgi:GT2 family glycosyltransferase